MLDDAGYTDGIVPFDGSDGRFFSKMKGRLRRAAAEIREKKFYLAQQQERRETFEEETEGLSPATVVAMRQELEAPFASRAYAMEVLEFLRLLCEGHNNRLQNLLREQPREMTNIDLVTEVYELLLALEPEARRDAL